MLYYNDYNIESGPKHASSMVLLKRLLSEEAPIHAVGIQGHWRSGSVPFEDIDKAISDYASLGLKVSITELDVTIRGASGGQFGGGFGRRGSRASTPASAEDLNLQAEDYAKLFAIFAEAQGRHRARHLLGPARPPHLASGTTSADPRRQWSAQTCLRCDR